jgi:hypothetical protein
MLDTLIVEVAVLVLYFISLFVAYKIKKLDFLIYASVFAFLFENFAVLFSTESTGYFYSENFLMYLGEVPLFVILAWGILLLGAHLVSLKLKMSKVSRVFFVSFFVTLVDFVIEGVAVDLGYWAWREAVGGGNVFSYIFAPNFIGWLGVSLGFVVCYEYLEWKWLSCFLGYSALLVIGFFGYLISFLFGVKGESGYVSLVIIFIGLFWTWFYFYHNNHILKKNRQDFRADFSWGKYVVWMRWFFYLFGLFFIVVNEWYLDFVYLSVVLAVLVLEVYFALRFGGVLRKMI